MHEAELLKLPYLHMNEETLHQAMANPTQYSLREVASPEGRN